MLVSQLTGLGDLGSAPKGLLNKQANVAASNAAKTNLTQKTKVAQALNKLVTVANYNRDFAAGNINPNFTKAPTGPTEDQALAQYKAVSNKVLGTHYATAPSASASSPSTDTGAPSSSVVNALKKVLRPMSLSVAPTGPTAPATSVAITPAPTPVQQAAADVQTQQAALTSTGGGGGGGGGGGDLAPTDQTDATLPDEPTGWAALSGGTKAAIIGGGLAAVLVGFYLLKRGH